MKLGLFASDIRNKIEFPMVSSDKSAGHNVSSDQLQQRESSPSDVTVSQEIHDTKVHSSKTQGARSITSSATKKEVKDSDAPACALQSEQEGSTCSLPLEKHLQTPDTLSRPLQSGQDSPSIIREKVSKDGYNWRKYGQKYVKGNEFIRSYYKCTHPTCQAKKQLEQSNNGQITDTVCIGQHNHPRPQLNTTLPLDCVLPVVEERPDKACSVNVEDKASIKHGCAPQQIKPLDYIQISKVSTSDEVKAAQLQLTRAKDEVHNNDYTEPKRLKKDNSNTNFTGVDKSSCESRVVVRTSSEVDLVNDGYRWRKYGQKLVKGNPNPRSYYRCSSPGCPVKKHMERASHDSKIVITTYEGRHDHEIPTGRTVTHTAATNTDTMAINCMPGTKSGGDTVCVDTGEHSRLDSETRLNKQLNGESIAKSKADDMVEFHAVNHRSEAPESKLSEEEQQNANSATKKDSASIDIVCPSSSEVPGRSNKQLKDEVKTKSEGSKDCLRVVAVHDTPDLESKFSKQSTPDAEPVQS